jgi:hypothetical protein
MMRTFMIAAAAAAILTLSPRAFAQQKSQYGSADEAKAMLMNAVAAVKADKAKALDMFNKGEGGFSRSQPLRLLQRLNRQDRCASNPNRQNMLGQDERTMKDSTGKDFGAEIYAAGQKPEGRITEVSYMFPKPVPKVSFVTKVGDLTCGVDYYK